MQKVEMLEKLLLDNPDREFTVQELVQLFKSTSSKAIGSLIKNARRRGVSIRTITTGCGSTRRCSYISGDL